MHEGSMSIGRTWLGIWRGWRPGVAACLALMLSCAPQGCAAGGRTRGWERTFYPSISGRVVDAETGAPIEGAVVLSVWTSQEGLPGLMTTKVAKVSEAVSDAEGRFRIEGTLRPDVDDPELTVYKRGYAAWNNWAIFPSREDRTDFEWKNGLVVKMERWKDEYSFNDHESFISRHTWTGGSKVKKRFVDAMEWERLEQIKEDNRIIEEKKGRGLRR